MKRVRRKRRREEKKEKDGRRCNENERVEERKGDREIAQGRQRNGECETDRARG